MQIDSLTALQDWHNKRQLRIGDMVQRYTSLIVADGGRCVEDLCGGKRGF